MKARYWIYGPKASGKTTLANRIAGTEAVTISGRSTRTAIERALSKTSSAIIEEFREPKANNLHLTAIAKNGSITRGKTDSRSIERIKFNLDTLIIISNKPPKDAVLASRFHVIKMENIPDPYIFQDEATPATA